MKWLPFVETFEKSFDAEQYYQTVSFKQCTQCKKHTLFQTKIFRIDPFIRPQLLKNHKGEYIRDYPLTHGRSEGVDGWVFTLHALPFKVVETYM